jgi:outer membrane protein TolC
VNAAKANQQATAADLATLDLALHAELATDYYTLRSEDAEQVLLEKTVEDYSRSLALTQRLYKGGGAAVADVDQAQAQLEIARTQAADIALQRAQTEHAIAVLIGENPSRIHLDSNPLPTDAVPPGVADGLLRGLRPLVLRFAPDRRRAVRGGVQPGAAPGCRTVLFSVGG